MKSITEIISDLSIDVACLLDEPEDTSYGRYAFTDGRYGFGRTLGRRASDSKILDNLKVAEGVNPKTILDKLSDSVQSMVEFNQGRKK